MPYVRVMFRSSVDPEVALDVCVALPGIVSDILCVPEKMPPSEMTIDPVILPSGTGGRGYAEGGLGKRLTTLVAGQMSHDIQVIVSSNYYDVRDAIKDKMAADMRKRLNEVLLMSKYSAWVWVHLHHAGFAS